MKKMMTMTAVVLMAGMMQAAVVNWLSATSGGSMMSAVVPGGATYTSGTVFLFLLTGQSAVPLYSAGAWNLNGATQVATGTIDSDGSAFGQAGLWGGTEGGSSTIVDGNFNATAFYTAVLVTQTGAATLGAVTSGSYYTATSLQFDAGSLDVANKNGSLFFGDDVTSTSWTAVPEPTSMALLALGAAALGLRRKFRA